ncbi:MAG TPA: hypothetical protein VK806_12265 [Bacteroidia bacterium]|jgi:hypothetical protein|nr:hypothetical protein [Bacteroidia bacterium]
MKKFDHPILIYLIISVISFGCATSLFYIGGSFAQVIDNQSRILGVSFQAGGAIGGFIIIFLLSQRAIIKFGDIQSKRNPTVNIKVYLSAMPDSFRRNEAYVGEYKIYNEDTADSRTIETEPFWEAGFLTVRVKDVGENDYLTVKITNRTNDSIWESETFHSRSPKIAVLNLLN